MRARTELPSPPDPSWPRLCDAPFPPYRYVPGRSPHPRRDPAGHMVGHEHRPPAPLPPARWAACEDYLYGVDLYNHAYWWEAHEALEGLWIVVGKSTEQGQYLQGVIQVAAGNLNRFMGKEPGAVWLWGQALERLAAIPDAYMGLDVRGFERDVARYRDGERALPALIGLDR